jgi:hypothetical protein
MRKNLGRWCIAFFLFWHGEVFASTYEWQASINKNEAYIGEAIHLKYECFFSDRGELYSIDFNPVGTYEKYDIELLRKENTLVDGKKISSFEFVVFAKSAGEIEFAFDVSMQKTTQDSIENTVLGRDNVEEEEFSVRIMRQKALHAKILDPQTPLVGSFTLVSKHSHAKIQAYEPYHLEVHIEGQGDLLHMPKLDYDIAGVKVFSEEPIRTLKLSADGYKGSVTQKFAFVSEHNFTLHAKNIEYFDLISKQKKQLEIEPIKVVVEGGFSKEELLDEVEEQESLNFDKDYLYYFFTFLAGFITAKLFKNPFKSKVKHTNPFVQKISHAKDMDRLLFVLLVQKSSKYQKLIQEIETKKITDFREAKKRALKLNEY